jgi:adenylyltransferase/sulfurtransferase
MLPVASGPTLTELTPEEMRRYARHLSLPEVGLEGQKKLKAARVLCIGAGGLGSPLALYLAAAGVGTIGFVDFDVVDASNLQRQILHGSEDVGRSKLESAAERVREINSNVGLALFETKLTSENALEIFRDFEIVADGTDNFPTRYLVNDACAMLGKPNVYASIFQFEGQASVFWAGHGPCYRCLYPEPPPPGVVPSCAEGGVLGILPGLLGIIQATETIKLILDKGDPLIGRLLLVDALGMRFREVRLKRNPDCALCGPKPTITQLIDYEEFCGMKEEKKTGGIPSITVEELKQKMDRGEKFVLLDVREPYEVAISNLPGSTLIPLGTLPRNVSRLAAGDEIVVYCRTGVRSAQAVDFLQKSGFPGARNLVGGINLWAARIDPKLPQY